MLRDFSACFKRYDIAILTYNIIANNVIFSAKGCKQHYTHKRRKSQRLYHSLTSAVTITYAPRENRRIIFSKALSSKLKSIYIFHLQYWCLFKRNGMLLCHILINAVFDGWKKIYGSRTREPRVFRTALYPLIIWHRWPAGERQRNKGVEN